jgi:hypothetical protein
MKGEHSFEKIAKSYQVHDITSRITVIFIFTAVRTSDLFHIFTSSSFSFILPCSATTGH